MGLHAFARYVKNVQLSELSRAAAVPSWVDGGFSSEMPCGGYYFIMSSLHCHHTHTHLHTCLVLKSFHEERKRAGANPFQLNCPGRMHNNCITHTTGRPRPSRAGPGLQPAADAAPAAVQLPFTAQSKGIKRNPFFHQLTIFAYANWSINCEALQAKQQKKRSQVGSALVIMNITHGKHLQEISFKKCFVFSFHYSLLNRSLLCTELLTT